MPKKKTSSHPHFCKLLDEAIKDETEGAQFYGRMKKKVGCPPMRKKFQTMVNDENRHKKTLKYMKKRFC